LEENGIFAIISAMIHHLLHPEVQARGSEALRELVKHGTRSLAGGGSRVTRAHASAEDTRSFVIQEGGIAAAVSAMQAHKEHLGIQLAAHEALTLMMSGGEEAKKKEEGPKGKRKSPLLGGGKKNGSGQGDKAENKKVSIINEGALASA
jgi:hypothetical protein